VVAISAAYWVEALPGAWRSLCRLSWPFRTACPIGGPLRASFAFSSQNRDYFECLHSQSDLFLYVGDASRRGNGLPVFLQ